jgi:hypothetical protein
VICGSVPDVEKSLPNDCNHCYSDQMRSELGTKYSLGPCQLKTSDTLQLELRWHPKVERWIVLFYPAMLAVFVLAFARRLICD